MDSDDDDYDDYETSEAWCPVCMMQVVLDEDGRCEVCGTQLQ